MQTATLRPFTAADRDWLVNQHGAHYASAEGFDETFPVLVGTILDAFIADHDSSMEQGWIAEIEGQRLGSIFCVRIDATTAKLRIFYLNEAARGQGLGKRLLSQCTDFARSVGYTKMQLWTHESHKAACALYAATGWQLTGSKPVHSFGQDLIEQSWEITL